MPKDHSPFALWLSTELEKSELSPIELSKCANIHKGTLSNILNGKRSPTLDICNAIAYFWGLPQEFVLHKAGIVQDIPESDEEDYRLWIQAFRTLPGADKKEILALMCLKAQEGIKMISDEAMFKSLKHQGVIFFQNTHEDDEVGTIHVSELFAAMIRHPQARVRQAVIASLLQKPHLAVHVDEALVLLSEQEAKRQLRVYYVIACLLQQMYQVKLKEVGISQKLPAKFLQDFKFNTEYPRHQLREISKLQVLYTGKAINWYGTFDRIAQRTVQWLERINRWETP